MIKILPESQGKILIVEASEKLTGDDYEKIFIPRLETLIKTYGKIRLLFYFTKDFRGWDKNALWDDAKFGFKHLKDFEKIAISGGPKWVSWGTNIFAHIVKCPFKTFEESEYSLAVYWIKE